MSKKSVPAALSSSEQAIMDQLWRLAPTSLNDLLEAVNADRQEPISRATLQTQLTRLETKGWVKRDDSSRAHIYVPAVAESHGRRSVLAALKERFFGGSSLALVRCLVENGEISEKELTELKEIVAQAKKPTGKDARP
jgi:BlaI family penicillinase repressor